MMASEGGPVFDVGPASGLGPTPEARPAAEGGSVFYAGPASGLGPTPEARPAAEGEPASTGGPEAEFHVTDRVSLLKTLKDTLQGDVPSTIWASLWLSDIDKLKELVDRVKQDVTPWASYLKSIESETRIVQRWCQRVRLRPATSTPQQPSTPQTPISATEPSTVQQQYSPLQSSPLQSSSIPQSERSRRKKRALDDDNQSVDSRSGSAKVQCYERDQYTCVLTKAAHPVDVAHLYPFSMRNLRQHTPTSFWSVLSLFWSQDRVEAWYNAIFSSDSGTEVVSNLMCLCPNAHKYHEKTFFALKPKEISNDKKTLKVEFYWLPRGNFSKRVDILRTPSISGHLDGTTRGVGLWNVRTKQMIRSGDIINLETNDPEKLPLLDFRLLEMQWILHRVSALSGAAEPSDDFDKDNDDDWDVALENEDDLDDLLTDDEWSAYTPSPRKPSPPSSPPPSSPPHPCPQFFPSLTKEVVFGTTADESIVSSAGEAIDPEAEVKKDAPKDEGKGKRGVGLGAVAEFEEREAKRMVLGGGKG